MSEDTAINFFRTGTADIKLNGKTITSLAKENNWTIMLKGARMGYDKVSIISPASVDLHPRLTIDSLFGNRPFKAKLLKSCDDKPLMGYYYFELKIPKKDIAFVKVSWISIRDKTALRIDIFDSWSNYAIKFACR